MPIAVILLAASPGARAQAPAAIGPQIAASAVQPSSATVNTPVPTPTPIAVTVDKDGFHPATIHVASGQMIAWTNADTKPHTATAADGTWDTGQIDPGRSASLQFFEVGRFEYLDGFNPLMRATLFVTPPGSNGQ